MNSTQFSSVALSCPTLCNPMNRSMPGLPVQHQLLELAQTCVHQVGDAIQPHLILCCRLLLPPSIFPSIRVFSNESALRIRWPKDWSFSLSISPSNEHPGLISFRMDQLDLLAVQGTLKSVPEASPRSRVNPLMFLLPCLVLRHPWRKCQATDTWCVNASRDATEATTQLAKF